MRVDATFDFEKRRHAPVKYDRELMGATLRAMKRVGEIARAREARHYDKRMALAKEANKAAVRAELEEGIALIQPARLRGADEAAVGAKEARKERAAKRMDVER
jgi:large subunit ribosomal protein L24e